MRRLALIGLALACCSEPAAAQYGGGGYVPPSGGGGGGDLLSTNNLSDVANSVTSLANLNGQTQADVLDDWAALGACVNPSEVPVCTAAGTYAYQDAATFRGTISAQEQGDILDDLNTLGAPTSDGEFLVADGAGSFAFETDATARASLGVLPSFNVCSTCAYTTIQSAITAADSAGGGVVKVAPGSYTEALTAAAGVHLLCDVPSAQVKSCRITGTAGNPAITYDIGTPGGARENHVSLARGFLLLSGGGVGVPAVSVECPVAAAQRVELYEVDMFSASGSGQALRMTCGATGSGGLSTVARIHGEYTQLASQGGSTESVLYHSGGWLDARGYVAIDADSADDVALEVAAAGAGTVAFADFLFTGTVQVGAAATTAVTLGQGIITSATAAPITTNGSGALSLGVVGLWAVAAAPAACIAGAGVVAHAPTSLNNVGNCGTLIASTVNGGAGPDFAGTFFASRLQQEVLGTAALVDTGTAIGDVVLLEDVGGSPALPAVDGSQLLNLPGGAGDLLAANNLSDVDSVATSRANLGLGSAAVLDVGTGANQVVQLDGSSRLPAVDGSQLTNLPAASATCITNLVAPTWYWDPAENAEGTNREIQAFGYPGALMHNGCGFSAWASNGSTSYFQISSADFGRPASYTMLYAYRPRSNTSHWIAGSGSSTNQTFLATTRNSSGDLVAYVGDNTNWVSSTVAGAFTPGQWVIVAIRYTDGESTTDIWLDGVAQSPTDANGGTLPTSTGVTAYAFSIGRQGTFSGSSTIGSIGPVYFWESALSDVQVEAESALLEAKFGL